MDAEGEKVIVVPRPSWAKRIVAIILLLLSAGLLYYVYRQWF